MFFARVCVYMCVVCNVRDYNSLLFNIFMKHELKIKIAQIARVHEKLAMRKDLLRINFTMTRKSIFHLNYFLIKRGIAMDEKRKRVGL